MKRAAIGVFLLAAVAAVIAAALLFTRSDKASEPEIALELPAQIARPDPLDYEPGRTEEYERAAAFGLSHVLFEKSPGGVLRAAQRTAGFRDLVDKAVSGSGIDADTVEAIVLLESAGREDVIAGDDPENASGLTQILAETATNFLGMPVDLEASRRLTDRLNEAVRRGDEAEAALLRSERLRVDPRFDPEQALAGTVRYLTEARKVFGRDDLAIVSYHMGIGNLASAVRAYTGRQDEAIDALVADDSVDYTRLYFDSSPTVHRAAWERLASFGDDSQTYSARLGENTDTYVALRPRAARLLTYLTGKVYELSGEQRPLAVTRATYDEGSAATLTPRDPGAAADGGVHATGFGFDIRRRYGSGAQAAAFQWTLERLEALGLIAWTRGRSVIHLVVSPRAM